MFFLLGNVVFSSSFTLLIKWAQARQRENVVTIGAINYVTALLCILPDYLQSGVVQHETSALVAGGIMGTCYFIAFFFVIHAIKWIGAAASTVISVLSIVVPITCGIFIWNEQPNREQYVGIAAALLALGLIGVRGKKARKDSVAEVMDSQLVPAVDGNESNSVVEGDASAGMDAVPWFTPIVLVVFFLLAGTNRLAQESFRHMASPEQRPVFLITAFAVASIPSIAILISRRKILRTELLFGVTMGLCNILQSHFILRSLKSYDGFIVFPVVSAGALTLTTIVTTQVFHERLTPQSGLGIGIAIVALILLNWG